MARIMAIDYGTKRMGIAVTDPLQIISTSLTTIHPKDAIDFFKDYFSREEVSCVVFGEPKQNDGSPSSIHEPLHAFVNLFKKSFPTMKVEFMDERFTSKSAREAMFGAGLKQKQMRNKSLVDQTSAVIILQTYMHKIGL
jgi:putative Holliday junction resolvase